MQWDPRTLILDPQNCASCHTSYAWQDTWFLAPGIKLVRSHCTSADRQGAWDQQPSPWFPGTLHAWTFKWCCRNHGIEKQSLILVLTAVPFQLANAWGAQNCNPGLPACQSLLKGGSPVPGCTGTCGAWDLYVWLPASIEVEKFVQPSTEETAS